jgi:hypothetical protein
MALLEGRRKQGRTPVPKAHYSFIVQHLFEQGRVGEGFRYLEELGAKQQVRLDGRCYAILGRGLLERSQAEAAAELLLGDMRRRRVPLCKELGPVLVAVARAVPGREGEAREVVEEMVRASILMSHAATALWGAAPAPASVVIGQPQEQPPSRVPAPV